jgi:hypothetical protein
MSGRDRHQQSVAVLSGQSGIGQTGRAGRRHARLSLSHWCLQRPDKLHGEQEADGKVARSPRTTRIVIGVFISSVGAFCSFGQVRPPHFLVTRKDQDVVVAVGQLGSPVSNSNIIDALAENRALDTATGARLSPATAAPSTQCWMSGGPSSQTHKQECCRQSVAAAAGL